MDIYMQGLAARTVCVYCGREDYHNYDFEKTKRFNDCVITVWIHGRRCPCGDKWIDAIDWKRAEVAEADCLLTLGTQDPDAFKFIRKVLGIGYADTRTFFGANEKEADAYRFYGLIQPAWWDIIVTLVAKEKAKLASPLPPCRGYTLG